MMDRWYDLPALAAATLALQVVLWLLARALGRRLEAGAVAAGLALPLVFLAPWLDGRILPVPLGILATEIPGATARVETPHALLNDAVYQFLPWEAEVRRAYAAGRLPLWSDNLDGGSSPWVNPQAGVLSPLAMATRLSSLAAFPLAKLLLQLMVAIEGCWLLCRLVGAGRGGALLGAASFGLGGGMTGWALFPHTVTAAWMPWTCAAAIVLARRPCRRAVAAAAAATGALLLSGHPETAFAGGLLAALCGLGLGRRRQPWGRRLAALAAAAGLGFGLAAVQWLPFLQYLPHSQRLAFAAETAGRSVDPWRPETWLIAGGAWALAAPLHPHAFGRPYEDPHLGPGNWAATAPLYSGILAAAGALVAAGGRRRRRAWLFLGFAAAMLLLAIGPLDQLHGRLPIFHASNTSRYLLAGALAFCVAAALGLDEILRRARRARLTAVVALAAAASLAVPLCRGVAWSVPTALLWLLLLGAAAWTGLGRRGRWIALAAVVILDLVPWARSHLPRAPKELLPVTAPALEVLRRELAGGPWRAVGFGHAVYPSLLPFYGIADVRPHNPIAHADQVALLAAVFEFDTVRDYFAPFRHVDHPLLDFLNVRAVVSRQALPAAPGLSRIDGGHFGGWVLYAKANARPRFFLATRSVVVDRGELAPRLRRLRDPSRVLLVADETHGRELDRSWPAGASRIAEMKPGHVVLEVAGAGERLLATSLPHPSGWSARAAGRRLEPLRIHGAFAGFRLPAEATTVELRFRPPGLVLGAASTLLALALCLLLLLGAGGKETKQGAGA